MFKILDWYGNVCFKNQSFESFDDAEAFLCVVLDEQYEDDRGEYYIREVINVQAQKLGECKRPAAS